MATKEDVKKLLAAGFPIPQVSEMLRLKPAFVEALLKDKTFAAEVDKAITKRALGGMERDDKIDSLHDQVLDMLEDNLFTFTKPAQLLGAFRAINGAKKERDNSMVAGNSLGNGAKVVNIILPPHLMIHAVPHQVNANNEVIVVDSVAMETMSSKEVASLMDKAKEEEKTEDTFKLHGKYFTISDLDLFDEDKIGVLNQNMNNLNLRKVKEERKLQETGVELDILAEEFGDSVKLEGPFTPVGCKVFYATAEAEEAEDEQELLSIYLAARQHNIDTCKSK